MTNTIYIHQLEKAFSFTRLPNFLFETHIQAPVRGKGSWWGTDVKTHRQVQIDIVGSMVEKDEYLIGSCKYKKEPVGVDELNLLKEYAEVFGKGRKYHFYIFSKGGFTSGLKELEKNGEVTLLTLEDI